MSNKNLNSENVDVWVRGASLHQMKALETAARHFDKNDALDVHTLEALYGQESSFGVSRRHRGISGAAGDFQVEKKTAERLGLYVSKENDERFDVDKASNAGAQYLKLLDDCFRTETSLLVDLKTIPVSDAEERKLFSIAAYNAGEGTIAKAQQLTKQANFDPEKWHDVKKFLNQTGISVDKATEIREYVGIVIAFEQEFNEKSPNRKEKKLLKPMSATRSHSKIGHWITKLKQHIFIEDR